LVRDIDFEVDHQKKPLRLSLIQGFAALKGKKPAAGGGDRTGTYTWPGGIELSTNVLNHNIIDVRGKRVLDIGTGTGVVGLAAVFAGASEVALTDGAVEVLQIAEMNLEKNLNLKLSGTSGDFMNGNPVLKSSQFNFVQNSNAAFPVNLSIGRLRWGDNGDIQRWLNWKSKEESSKGKFDVILASEVAYQGKNLEILLSTIEQLLDPNGLAVLRLTPEITNDGKGVGGLVDLIKKTGMTIVSLPDIKEDNSQIIKLKLKT